MTALPAPFIALTDEQADAVRRAFAAKKRAPVEADLLLAEWPTITSTAFGHAAVLSHTTRTQRRQLTTREKAAAVRSLTNRSRGIARSISELQVVRGGLVGAVPVKEYLATRDFLDATIAGLERLGRKFAAASKRTKAAPVATERASSGTPRWIPERALLEVISAYFKQQGWPLSSDQGGLLAGVAYAILPGERSSMNAARRRSLAVPTTPYQELRRRVQEE